MYEYTCYELSQPIDYLEVPNRKLRDELYAQDVIRKFIPQKGPSGTHVPKTH